ncbi:MAG: PAS domain-containing protein, partial [Leptolyngbyaceae cyanobacterium SM2_5_2]|nr:PAS domain-containing protein [Leptolyngbyaceae cyanobacterium SM2_5_2]
RVDATIENSIMTGFPFVEEYRYRRLDGRWVWLWVRGKGIYTETGQLEQVLGVVQDITDRKRTEIALQQSQEQLSLAVEFGRIAIWNWDVSTDQLAWNDISFEILGYEPGSFEPTYADWLQAVHPEDRDTTTQAIGQALMEGRSATNAEYRVIRPDGTQRWLLDSGRGIYDADGHLVRAAGIMLDITERKITELELQEREAQIQAIAANLPGYFFRLILEPDGQFTLPYISDKVEAIFGVSKAELQAHPERAFDRLHPDDVEKAQAHLFNAELGPTPNYVEVRVLQPMVNGYG